MITVFKTYEEARDFAKSLNLSYVPEEAKKDIIGDAMNSVIFGIMLKETDWASSDIRNEIKKTVGYLLLQYMEWKAKNPNGEG
jgi:hypothetical protein